ncbi:hypothetical protein K470DRAFT_223779 [Piedraia hortae CBS 480.64]|uniref:Extracelular serine carboxypeptidase n=1 Tax=Piedraia hortae CBS 480.64 TaxID=1314780 RepID=A0A6A7BPL5_9PEZI|nr:hypothetical protein K470DRAFT_223779 [Piedraia hortae CBS 480.64]
MTWLSFCLFALASSPIAAVTAATNRSAINYVARTIDMPIDHFPHDDRYAPHTNKTFKQRYFVDDSYYRPGGPVFLYIGGETSGESRFSNMQTGIIQILMEATSGLGVILENRYYGKSFPFESSTVDELRFLTTEQTIADNAYFAQHASFPGIDANLTAPGTPWIMYGGSLAGAQTVYTLAKYGGRGGIIWGGIGSSATTGCALGYDQWYAPILRYGPQDCVGSIVSIVDNIDRIFATGNDALIRKMKGIFGLEDLSNGDFAMTIAFPIGGPMFYPTYTWQELIWNQETHEDFWYFCTNVTSDTSKFRDMDFELASHTGGRPWKNLGNYANYIKSYMIPTCKDSIQSCYGTQNQSKWADATNSADRSYLYSTCTEGGAYQAAPKRGPSLISRVLDVNRTQQWCTWAFPPGKYNKIPPTPKMSQCGDIVADRLARIDGDQDPWLDLCYYSHNAPERYTYSEEDAIMHPHMLITGGGHHWDSHGILNVEAEPQFIREAHHWEIRIVKRWLADFWKNKKGYY